MQEKVIEWEDVVGAEEKLEQEGVGAMGKMEWKPMKLAEGEGRKKGQVGGFYVVEETEEGGAR